MANNRLYIQDTETNESILVAKSFGDGWEWRVDPDELTNWLMNRDWAGQDVGAELTALKFITEYDSGASK
jgi:hypothetical protein